MNKNTTNKNKRTIHVMFSVLLCISGSALGHAQQSTVPGAARLPDPGSVHVPMTPALKAELDEVYRLDQASAAALDAGQYAEAENNARQSLSIGHDSGLAQELLASALNAQGKKQEALEVYKEMTNEGDAFPRNQLPYALLLLNSGQWAPAVTAYNKALLTLADGKLVRANSHFSPVVLEPAALGTAIHIALGLTYNWSGSWGQHQQDDKALLEYTKALQLAPNSDLANFYYGYGLQKLGRKAQANAAFQKTVKMAKGEVKAAAEQALRKNKKPV